MQRPKPLERKVIARPEDYNPSSSELEVIGAFNPPATIIKTSNGLETLLMIRVAEIHKKTNDGKVYLPFFEIPNQEGIPPRIDFDIYSKKRFYHISSKGRVKVYKKEVKLPNRTNRLRHISLPRIMWIDKNGNIKREQTYALHPGWEYERFGTEDIRITHMNDGKYILTSVSPHRDFGVSTAFLETQNFENYERLPKDNTPRPIITSIKDVVLFPEKVPSPFQTETIKKGKKIYAALIRPNAFSDISPPGIWVSYSPDLVHWGQGHRLTISKEKEITGPGTPVIKVDNMWLGAYHETHRLSKTKLKYNTKLIGMDSEEPWKNCQTSGVLLTREDYRDILPEDGYVPEIVFTSGMTEIDDITTFFSGIDDTWTVMDKFYTEDLIKYIDKS